MAALSLAAISLALAVAPPRAAAAEAPTAGIWRFIAPEAGDPFEHPPFRALVLTREKPEGLFEKADYRGASRRYAQVRYGSPGSVRVAIVLDEAGPGDVDLYVDANRDRKIDARDRVTPAKAGPGRERIWRLPLDVAMVEGEETKTTPRAVVFRLGATGRTLGYATAGYLEGTVAINRETRSARRMDGDGNGLMTDAQDRIWVELDGDGGWDPASEQFLYATILNLGGARYVVRSDPLGTRLALEPLVGTGTVRLAFTKSEAAELNATLVGRDGSAFGLSANEPATVPVGEYRLGTVTATFNDPRGSQSWSFIFSDNGARGEPKWYAVARDGQVTIDPIGKLDMRVTLADQIRTAGPGDDLPLRPLLYTGDGLLINVAYRGTPVSPSAQEGLGAALTLATTDGTVLGSAHSGFA